jgi:hypothetical protein
MNLQVETRIPEVWLRSAELQRKQADQHLISALKRVAPQMQHVTTFGIENPRYGVELKGFALDHSSFMAAVVDASGARIPSISEVNVFLEQEYNATGYFGAMTEVLEYTIKNGVWVTS